MAFKILWDDVSEPGDFNPVSERFSLSPDSSLNLNFNNKKACHTFIKGDNYPALRLLEEKYSGKIDLIYIDPPYNTGKKSFCYNDALFMDNKTAFTSQDKHSAWLSFMQRRLTCAKKLLTDEGCIFIAIGMEELYHLKLLCDQIFGEENFINDFMWLHGKGKKDNYSRTMQQSNLCYAKNIKKLKPFTDYEITDWAKTNPDDDERGKWFSGSISFDEKRSNPNHPNFFEIVSPSGKKWCRQWLVSKEEMDQLLKDKKIYWGAAPQYANVPRRKIFNGEKNPVIPKNIIEDLESTRDAQNYVDKILGQKMSFDNPKPVNLIKRLIEITGKNNDITVMDFFAGSGTTLEAVSELNMEDNGLRKCILIQKPEKIEKEESIFSEISEICYKRVKWVLEKNQENLEYLELKDCL